jgi:hypothetical protein
VAGAEAGFWAIQIGRQRLSFHHQTLIRGLEMQWTAKVAVQVEKRRALVVLSGQLLALEEEQAACLAGQEERFRQFVILR